MVLTEKIKTKQGGSDLRAVVYSGTRNVYRDMSRACKSLLLHSPADNVYFLTEDAKFPEVLPSCVKVVNVSKQKYFKKDGPNFGCKWTYMVLLRAAYPTIFEQLDEIVLLDNDTTVLGDVKEILRLPLGDNYLAGVAEPAKEVDGEPYINMGVCVMNLRKMREDGIDAKAVHLLNTKKYAFAEQDVLNELCAGKKIVLDPKFNISNWTRNSGKTVIRHFAAEKGWREKEIVKKYDRIPWAEIREVKKRG